MSFATTNGSSESGGVAPSSHHDRAENPPVRAAGVEEGPDPVVLEVAESEPDALDPLDQIVERLGGSVGDAGPVEVDDLVEPAPDGASQPLDLGGHGPFAAVGLELFEDHGGLLKVAAAIEVTEALLGPIGNGHLAARITQLEQ